MNDNQIHYDDEINLAEIAQTIWDGKWIIVAITSISIIGGGLFSILAPKSYSGSLELRPIPLSQSQQYNELNSLEFYTITPKILIESLIEDISKRDTLANALRNNLKIPRHSNESEEEFELRLLSIANSFKLLAPTPANEGRNREVRLNWEIEFNLSNASKENIQNILRQALTDSNENVRRLKDAIFQQKTNIAERTNKYSVEDLAVTINNQKEDYEKKVRNRLAFLNEQSQIARSLNIAKNTIETQTFQSGSSIVANVVAETPFYLRGYEAIEKEAILLKTRKGVEAFITELIELEQKKREIIQDRSIERAKIAFNSTPIVNGDFSAAFYDIASIEFKSNIRTSMILALAFIGGGFLSLLVVLIRSSILKFKNKQQL